MGSNMTVDVTKLVNCSGCGHAGIPEGSSIPARQSRDTGQVTFYKCVNTECDKEKGLVWGVCMLCVGADGIANSKQKVRISDVAAARKHHTGVHLLKDGGRASNVTKLRKCGQCSEQGSLSLFQVKYGGVVLPMSWYKCEAVKDGRVCNVTWGLCNICIPSDGTGNTGKQRQRIRDSDGAGRHFRNVHAEFLRNATLKPAPAASAFCATTTTSAVDDDRSFPTMDDGDDNDDYDHGDKESSVAVGTGHAVEGEGGLNLSWAATIKLEPPSLAGLPSTFSRFFGEKGSRSIAEGAGTLVATSQIRTHGAEHSNYHPSDIKMTMDLCLLSSGMTKKQIGLLGEVLDQILARGKIDYEKEKLLKVTLPLTEAAFRNQILEGTTSIISNLPIPEIETLDDGHAYCGVSSIVSFALAMGIPIEPLVDMLREPPTKVRRVSDTKKGRQMFTECKDRRGEGTCFICAIVWCDDCDPTTNVAMTNRNGVWVFTINLAMRHSCGGSYDNTFIVAIGPKNIDHESVLRRFQQDLSNLTGADRNLFYHGGLRHNISVDVGVYCSLMDVPERRKTTGVAGHNSKVCRRWRYAGDLQYSFDVLASCEACYQRRLGRHLTIELQPSCTCADWDMDNRADLLQTPKTSHYPTSGLPSGFDTDKCTEVRKMSFATMLDAVNLAAGHILKESWESNVALDYLRSVGVSDHWSELLIDLAEKSKEAVSSQNREVEEDDLEALIREIAGVVPALWVLEGFSIDDCLDAVMHMMFLGVTKSTTTIIVDWLKACRKNTHFGKVFGKLTSLLPAYQKISWLRVREYGAGTMGSWISQDHLGFARIYLWFYSRLDVLKTLPFPPDPELGQNSLCIDLRNWLRYRGLDSKGVKSALRERIQEDKEKPGGPTPRIVPNTCEATLVSNVVKSLVRVVALIMQEESDDEHILEVDRAVKLFLSDVKRVDDLIRDPPPLGKLPLSVILSKTNFVSMLNLAKNIEEYGPCRLWWEGDSRGEGILKKIKSLFSSMRPGWETVLMTKFYQDFALRMIAKALKPESIMDDTKDLVDESSFYRYKNRQSIIDAIATAQGLSGVLLDDKIVAAVTDDDQIVILEYQCDHCFHSNATDIIFTQVLVGDAVDEQLQSCWKSRVKDYCFLLPRFNDEGQVCTSPYAQYYTITSTWRERRGNGEFALQGRH